MYLRRNREAIESGNGSLKKTKNKEEGGFINFDFLIAEVEDDPKYSRI